MIQEWLNSSEIIGEYLFICKACEHINTSFFILLIEYDLIISECFTIFTYNLSKINAVNINEWFIEFEECHHLVIRFCNDFELSFVSNFYVASTIFNSDYTS
jgi:hypothetical protein